MSASTIDRYLAPAKARDPLRGKSTTRPGTMLRNSITVRKASDETEDEPGFFEVDTVAHCGPTLKGEFARSVNFTDVRTGWVFTIAIRNNARVDMLAALDAARRAIPYRPAGLDCDYPVESPPHRGPLRGLLPGPSDHAVVGPLDRAAVRPLECELP
jgi:hypothetical protein